MKTAESGFSDHAFANSPDLRKFKIYSATVFFLLPFFNNRKSRTWGLNAWLSWLPNNSGICQFQLFEEIVGQP